MCAHFCVHVYILHVKNAHFLHTVKTVLLFRPRLTLQNKKHTV